MNGIANGSCLNHLNYLLEFLAAWEKRPAYLTPIAYRWCSAISEAAGRLDPSEVTTNPSFTIQSILRHQLRLRPQDLPTSWAERGFSGVGPDHDPARLDPTSHHSRGRPQHLTPPMYAHLLSIILEIGFRHVAPSHNQLVLHLDHTSHHKWVFETAFTSGDDDVIADAVCVWIIGDDSTPLGSCARYLAKRVERDAPFSPMLRQASIRTIEHIWRNELKVSGLDTVRWLNRLNVDVDDAVDMQSWAQLLVGVMRSPMGLESLSSHYWHLLDKFVVASKHFLHLRSRDTEVMRSLEEAEDWEKLGAWAVIVWSSSPWSGVPISELVGGIEGVTLKLLLRRPSAILRFEDLCEAGILANPHPKCQARKDKLQRICDQARAELPSESPPP